MSLFDQNAEDADLLVWKDFRQRNLELFREA